MLNRKRRKEWRKTALKPLIYKAIAGIRLVAGGEYQRIPLRRSWRDGPYRPSQTIVTKRNEMGKKW
jgi:hypothetical protein